MTERKQSEPLSVRDTARGVAVRAGLLSVGALVVGAAVFSVAAEAASGIVKLGAAATVLAVGGGIAVFEFRRAKRRITA